MTGVSDHEFSDHEKMAIYWTNKCIELSYILCED